MNGDVVCVSTRIAHRMWAQGHDFGFHDATAAGVALRNAAAGRLRFASRIMVAVFTIGLIGFALDRLMFALQSLFTYSNNR